MIELTGKYNTAKIYTDNVDTATTGQIIALLNQEFVRESIVRIMPDCHAGAGCVIGTTMTITDKVVPNLVGVDIGCGILAVELSESRVDIPALDSIIHKRIPCGQNIREIEHKLLGEARVDELFCLKQINRARAELSVGTLGGGNHFIELDKDDDGKLYLVIHSGSRYLGKQIAEHYQKLAYQRRVDASPEKAELERLNPYGNDKVLKKRLKNLRPENVVYELSYLDGELLRDYLHDMQIAQEYARLNRMAIASDVLKHAKLRRSDSEDIDTIHNYIDMENKILRKGAISAQDGELCIVPMNMRDGSLICRGKGNPDWNCSAPHGAGRIMSRSEAKKNITLSQFKDTMKGIYSTTIGNSTVDESPFAYKDVDEILSCIGDTITVEKTIKPVYNFKAGMGD
ncbi:RNA-splicing ligase RtcB [Clostridia bacterium]|nr:RNA-splicing ligase RtcB [Clostridia bacterium]